MSNGKSGTAWLSAALAGSAIAVVIGGIGFTFTAFAGDESLSRQMENRQQVRETRKVAQQQQAKRGNNSVSVNWLLDRTLTENYIVDLCRREEQISDQEIKTGITNPPVAIIEKMKQILNLDEFASARKALEARINRIITSLRVAGNHKSVCMIAFFENVVNLISAAQSYNDLSDAFDHIQTYTVTLNSCLQSPQRRQQQQVDDDDIGILFSEQWLGIITRRTATNTEFSRYAGQFENYAKDTLNLISKIKDEHTRTNTRAKLRTLIDKIIDELRDISPSTKRIKFAIAAYQYIKSELEEGIQMDIQRMKKEFAELSKRYIDADLTGLI